MPDKTAMAALQQEAGTGGSKHPAVIMRNYLMQQMPASEVEKAMQLIASSINMKKSRPVQFGNTVFWAMQGAPGELDVHVFTEEQPKTLIKRFQQAAQWAKSKGFKKITSTLLESGTAEMVKAAGFPVKITQTTVNMNNRATPAYKMEVGLV